MMGGGRSPVSGKAYADDEARLTPSISKISYPWESGTLEIGMAAEAECHANFYLQGTSSVNVTSLTW